MRTVNVELKKVSHSNSARDQWENSRKTSASNELQKTPDKQDLPKWNDGIKFGWPLIGSILRNSDYTKVILLLTLVKTKP